MANSKGKKRGHGYTVVYCVCKFEMSNSLKKKFVIAIDIN